MQRSTRARVVGALGAAVALLLIYFVSQRVAAGSVSTLNIPRPNLPPSTPPLIAIPLPTIPTVVVLQGLLLLTGLFLVVRRPNRWVGPYVSALIGGTLLTILIWAIAGNSTDIVDVLARVIRFATPITLGALAGILCERSGVTNVGIEGTMLIAACAAYIAAITLGGMAVAVVAGMLAGAVVAALHGVLSIRFKINQIISGTVINILAVGLTGFLRGSFITGYESDHAATIVDQQLPINPIPGLSSIPVLGPIFFNHQPITYIMLITVVVVHVLLFHTVWGLRTRAIGEHPKAADSVGINVNQMRMANVVVSGLLAGLGGAWFSIEATFRFNDFMTNGTGFIALAAVIFGKWTPLGAFGGALLFSSADALQIRIQGFDFALPPQFLQMLPYLVTMIVLAGVIGRAQPPAAIGEPYEK